MCVKAWFFASQPEKVNPDHIICVTIRASEILPAIFPLKSCDDITSLWKEQKTNKIIIKAFWVLFHVPSWVWFDRDSQSVKGRSACYYICWWRVQWDGGTAISTRGTSSHGSVFSVIGFQLSSGHTVAVSLLFRTPLIEASLCETCSLVLAWEHALSSHMQRRGAEPRRFCFVVLPLRSSGVTDRYF